MFWNQLFLPSSHAHGGSAEWEPVKQEGLSGYVFFLPGCLSSDWDWDPLAPDLAERWPMNAQALFRLPNPSRLSAPADL